MFDFIKPISIRDLERQGIVCDIMNLFWFEQEPKSDGLYYRKYELSGNEIIEVVQCKNGQLMCPVTILDENLNELKMMYSTKLQIVLTTIGKDNIYYA